MCDIFPLKTYAVNDLESTESYSNSGLDVFKNNMDGNCKQEGSANSNHRKKNVTRDAK